MQTQETNSAVNGAINSTQYSNNVNSGKQQKGENGNPLFMIGFVKNRRTYVNEINELLEGTGVTVSVGDINLMVETNGFDNRNIHGYSRESDGTQIAPANVHYKLVKTGWSTKEGREIVGWFTKSKKGFEGITWGTEASFISSVANSKKFRIGEFYFDEWCDGLSFLEDLAQSTIPEKWSYQHTTSNMMHPILKSYIENIFTRLQKEGANGGEGKIIFSQDGRWMVFNTNLLDKFFHEIIIVAEVRTVGGKRVYFNPVRSKNEADRRKKTFRKGDEPVAPKFFENVDEVIFQTKWTVDKDFDKFTHIIEQRIKRFPAKHQGKKLRGTGSHAGLCDRLRGSHYTA